MQRPPGIRRGLGQGVRLWRSSGLPCWHLVHLVGVFGKLWWWPPEADAGCAAACQVGRCAMRGRPRGGAGLRGHGLRHGHGLRVGGLGRVGRLYPLRRREDPRAGDPAPGQRAGHLLCRLQLPRGGSMQRVPQADEMVRLGLLGGRVLFGHLWHRRPSGAQAHAADTERPAFQPPGCRWQRHRRGRQLRSLRGGVHGMQRRASGV
mmetsp:Transcript_105644/g.251910  ORF Transcript_105644/g.251910 Transcript_105644/m.251910 type:complete len:205 (+) Transcript_105644:1838-2452(+)